MSIYLAFVLNLNGRSQKNQLAVQLIRRRRMWTGYFQSPNSVFGAFRYEFFNDLYHRFLLTPKTNMKCLCLQAMAVVYGRCVEEIGQFNDTRYIVGMLDRVGFKRTQNFVYVDFKSTRNFVDFWYVLALIEFSCVCTFGIKFILHDFVAWQLIRCRE